MLVEALEPLSKPWWNKAPLYSARTGGATVLVEITYGLGSA